MEHGPGSEPTTDELDADQADFDLWVATGLRTLELYLARFAAFDDWCRDQRRRYGGGSGT